MTKQVTLRQAFKLMDCTDVEMHKGYYYCYGFFERDGQLYYFSTPDLRVTYGRPRILTRTAESRQDFTGGMNQYDFCEELEELGYSINFRRGVPHKKEEY